MKRLRLIYEQIETAKRFLLSGSLLGTRLSLILLDNAAELLMQRELAYQFAWDDQRLPKFCVERTHAGQGDRGAKYSVKERKQSREFEPKTRLLQFRLGRISAEDRTILRICHQRRNEAFHHGKMRSDVLPAICQQLFRTVVGLTVKLPPRSMTLPPPKPAPDDAAFLDRFGISHALYSRA